MPRNARWLIWALIAASMLGLFFAQRDPVGKASHAQCFTSRDCPTQESCAVNPKGDGFATIGVCAEPCQTDDVCLNGWRCQSLVETKDGILVPAGTRGASGPRKLVCAPGTMR